MVMRNKILFFIIAIALGVVGVVAFAGWGTGSGNGRTIDNSKLIKFSHQLHITQVGIDCATCHAAAKSEKSSDKIMPGHDECGTCHSDEISSNCGFCHVNPEKPQALPSPDFEVLFNHKKHVVDQKMECTTCHVGLDKVDYASASNMPTMATCNTCHNSIAVNNQCETCHSNLATLRPVSHDEGNFLKDHAKFARLDKLDARCQSCHTDDFCSQCHDGTNLTQLTGKEATGMLSPRVLGDDNAKALAGQSVHDINYIYTHGIDAKDHETECQTCHDQQTFCNDCHTNGSQAFGGALPQSHQEPDFVILGVGSGGGRHAELAKRDIETCISCHDVEGQDPTCMQCHTLPTGSVK
jgi:Cytochrome c7 and related cytochrome c